MSYSVTHIISPTSLLFRLITFTVIHDQMCPCVLCLCVCVCMNIYVCMMNSTHSEKAIMFSNGKVMSERLFEPLSSVSGSIV